MAQRQLEEKVEAREKEISGLKELLICKNSEKLTEEVQESNRSKKVAESTMTVASSLKKKGKIGEEEESDQADNVGSSCKSKYKSSKCRSSWERTRNHGFIGLSIFSRFMNSTTPRKLRWR